MNSDYPFFLAATHHSQENLSSYYLRAQTDSSDVVSQVLNPYLKQEKSECVKGQHSCAPQLEKRILVVYGEETSQGTAVGCEEQTLHLSCAIRSFGGERQTSPAMLFPKHA